MTAAEESSLACWTATHAKALVRVLGSLGFRKLVFKIYYYIPRPYDGGGNGLDLVPFKKGAFAPFYISIPVDPRHLQSQDFNIHCMLHYYAE